MNKYYWYTHTDPETEEIVYVGHGYGGRAWQCGSVHGSLRSKEHREWSDALLEKGLTPDQWVEIKEAGLSKDDAKLKEKLFIHEMKPLFNQSIRSPLLKFTLDKYDDAATLRAAGLSYSKIGKILNLPAMCIFRGLTGRTISLETAIVDKIRTV